MGEGPNVVAHGGRGGSKGTVQIGLKRTHSRNEQYKRHTVVEPADQSARVEGTSEEVQVDQEEVEEEEVEADIQPGGNKSLKQKRK